MTEFASEEMVLNMGPHHPSTHGVLRFILYTDGEIMRRAVPDIGYLHRGIEKIAEKVTYHGFMPFSDRIDYVASINCNVGYALAVERMAGIEVPEKAEYLRVIGSELTRIASHFIGFGAQLLDLGAVTPFVHCLRERETYNTIIEKLCGARLTHCYARIGGVAFDEPKGFRKDVLKFIDHLEYEFLEEFNNLASFNAILIHRLKDVGIITPEQALEYSLSGPNLRGAGIKFDLRKNEPYSIYDRFQFDIPVGSGSRGTLGDCYDRYFVRVEEVRESCRIVRQAINSMPESGEILAKVPKVLRLPKGEIYVRTECPRGELGFYIESDGGKSPYRLKIRTGSFSAMSIIEEISQGVMVADLVAIIGSLDIVAPEVDR